MWEGADLKTWPMINSSATAVTLGCPRKPLTRSQRLAVMHAGKKAAAVVQSIGQPFPAGRHATSIHRLAGAAIPTPRALRGILGGPRVIPDEARSPWIT